MKTKYFRTRKLITAKEFQLLFGARFLLYIEDPSYGIRKVEVADKRVDVYAADEDIIGSVEYVNGYIKFSYDIETPFVISKEKVSLVSSEIEKVIKATIS